MSESKQARFFSFFLVFSVLFFAGTSCAVQADVAPVQQLDMESLLGGPWYLVKYMSSHGVPPDNCTNESTAAFHKKTGSDTEFQLSIVCKRPENQSPKYVKNKIRLSLSESKQAQKVGRPVRQGAFEIDPGWWSPKWFDFWVIAADLSGDDAYVVIGGPSKTKLLVFAKTPHFSAGKWENVLAQVQAMGYQTEGRLLPK